MRLNLGQAILQSRVGRQLLGTFLVLVALPVGAISLLAYQLTEYVMNQSAAQLSSELAKAVGINIIDRLRAAESLLQLHGMPAGQRIGPVLLNAHLQDVFSSVELLPSAEVDPMPDSRAILRMVEAAQPGTLPSIELLVPLTNAVLRGRLAPDYLWENAQSGTFRICFASPQLTEPFCQGLQGQAPGTLRTQREIFLRPYFDAPAWTITTFMQPDVRRYLPIGIAGLVGNVAGIVFLLALACSSVMLRRLTRPLDSLTASTRAVLAGDFTRRVHIAGKSSEFTELADSFNAMIEEVGHDLALVRVLAQMDQAIIEQRPFTEVVHLMLTHLKTHQDAHANVHVLGVVRLQTDASVPFLLSLSEDGSLQQFVTFMDARSGVATSEERNWSDIAVAQTGTQAVWLRLGRLPLAQGRQQRELAAFGQRLAVALHAEQHELQLRTRATRDSLTGLLNRLGLLEAVEGLSKQPSDGSTRAPFAVVYMDLDGFKEINDAYGHFVGDCVLREVAARLRSCLGPRALALARPGGDEFVFVLAAQHAFRADVNAVMDAVRAPYQVPGHLLTLAASLGVALFPSHGSSHEDLLKHADLAMYTAKGAGRNIVVEFEPALAAQQSERAELRQAMRQALEDQQMYVVFQPRVDAQNRKIASVEALVRWRHPEKGLVSPDTFIPIAEESGFILELGLWVLRQALQQFARWRSDPAAPVQHLSVNLSPVQLADPEFPRALQNLLCEFDIRPGELELEITEGALIQDVDAAVAQLEALRAHGVAIALDDFGVGYSAMRYLSRLPFDTLKIDKSFVFAFGAERPALAIATAIVALGQALDKRVVAEGVETSVQADILQTLEVDELQGYLFGKPQIASDLTRQWATSNTELG